MTRRKNGEPDEPVEGDESPQEPAGDDAEAGAGERTVAQHGTAEATTEPPDTEGF